MKHMPPKWADKFLEWYCRPELLEEIQGDAYELFFSTVRENRRKASLHFIWNVIRYFRWKNIRRQKRADQQTGFITSAMLKNIFLVWFRHLVRQPGNSFLNVFGLAAGFTCAFLIMLWVTHEYSFDRFHADTDRIFRVVTHADADGTFQTYSVASGAVDITSIPEAQTLVSVSSGTRWPHELCFRPDGKPDECIYLNGVYASEHLFSVFNFPIVKGDANPLKGTARIAISEAMASKLFGAADPIGKTIRIDDHREVMIASVFQDIPVNSSLRFDFALTFDVLKKQWGLSDERFAQTFFNIYIKTNRAIPAAQLTEKLNDVRVLTERHKTQHLSYQAHPLADWRLKGKFENGKNTGGRITYVVLFIIIGALIVVMAVINFVNMSTARAALRAREIGIRKVTGAFRGTIAAQFMGESFLVVLMAFALSVLAIQLALPHFNTLLGEPISFNMLTGNVPVYLFLFLAGVALLAGVYPAFIMSSFLPARVLKGQLTGNASGSSGFRKVLLVVQLSVSAGIIIFSSVLYLQMNYISARNLGFDRGNMIRLEPTYQLLKKFEGFSQELSQDLSITAVGASSVNPLSPGGANRGVEWPGKAPDQTIMFTTIFCSHEFPEMLGLRLIGGRNFQSQPVDSTRTEVLLTEDAVKAMGLTRPEGTEIRVGGMSCVVIGVVNNFHTGSLHEARLPAILCRTDYKYTSAIYVKYRPGTAQQAMETLSRVYKRFEPSFTMKYWFQDDTFDDLYKTETMASRLALVFTLAALVIAIIGIAGLATFNTMRKYKEIGIRRVFGASKVQVLAMLFNHFSLVLITSMVIAGPVSWYVADRWLQNFAYHTEIPWWIFGAAFTGVAALIAAITWLQAMKAVSANPTQTLRSE
jgi:putative ABC transport system permease protein